MCRLRREAAIGVVVALLAPSADHVVALVDRGEQPRNFLGRILQVGVERDDDLAAALAKAGQYRGVLAEVARQFDHAHRAVCARGNSAQEVERFVARTVVDEQHFPRPSARRASPAPAATTASAEFAASLYTGTTIETSDLPAAVCCGSRIAVIFSAELKLSRKARRASPFPQTGKNRQTSYGLPRDV